MNFAEFLVRRAIVIAVVLLIVTVGGVTLLKRLLPAPTPPLPAALAPAAAEVTLTIDFGDGFSKTYRDLPTPPDATVVSVLQAAAESTRPHALTVDLTGSGETAFIRGFDGVGNQGSGPTGRYWQFLVNGALGSRGAGVTPIKPGDAITWTLAAYAPSPTGESAPAATAPTPSK